MEFKYLQDKTPHSGLSSIHPQHGNHEEPLNPPLLYVHRNHGDRSKCVISHGALLSFTLLAASPSMANWNFKSPMNKAAVEFLMSWEGDSSVIEAAV